MPEPTPPDRYRSGAPDWMVESAREYISCATWTFASTMADNPHWYAVRRGAQQAGMGLLHERLYLLLVRRGAQQAGMGLLHERLYLLLRDYHYIRRWHGREYRSVDLDGYSYWIMQNGTVINRKPLREAGWEG